MFRSSTLILKVGRQTKRNSQHYNFGVIAMGSWFSNLLGSNKEPPETTNDVVDEQLAPQPQVDIDASFRHWLFNGDAENDAINQSMEKAVLYALKQLTESKVFSTHLVPRMPTVLPQLMVTLHDRAASNAQLSQQIGRDPSLIAEVIKEANSSYYRPTDKIASVDKAVFILGNRGLRMAVAKAYLRPIINVQKGPLSKHAAPRVWEQSEKCAMACCILSSTFKVNPFEAFLAGLIKNLGMTIALQLIDQLNTGKEVLCHSPDFCQSVESYAQKLSACIAQLWEMPETVVTAIQELNQPTSDLADRSALGITLLMGDRVSKLRIMVAHGQINEADSLATGFSEQEFLCYQKLRSSIKEVD